MEVHVPDRTGDWTVEADRVSGAAGNILLTLFVLQKFN